MSPFLMHWIVPLVTLIIAILLQKVIASKASGKAKFIIPVLFFIIIIGYNLQGIILYYKSGTFNERFCFLKHAALFYTFICLIRCACFSFSFNSLSSRSCKFVLYDTGS